MIVHLDGRTAERIADAVISGMDPGDIAVLADGCIQERTCDTTFTNFSALRYFIRRSEEDPEKYIGITGDAVRRIVEDEAERIGRSELGEVVTFEFRSWMCFFQADFIAEVSNVVADAVIRHSGKSAERRFG